MNLLQAIDQSRQEQLAKAFAEEVLRLNQVLDRRKLEKYFHHCAPTCKPLPEKDWPDGFAGIVRLAGDGCAASPRIEDHTPLPGNPRPTCRILYQKHLQFMAAGKTHRERLFLASNRSGKSECAAFEIRCHLTGSYPKWWKGRRFAHPIDAWAAGDTRLTTRNIIQNALLGPHEVVETQAWCGMIDPHLVVDVTRSSGGISHCIDTVSVQHVEKIHGAPAISKLQFLSYDMGRRVFQGTERHVIWLDEEPPDGAETQEQQAQGSSDILTECVLRTMTVDGIVMLTFTPLRGMTLLLKNYIESAVMPSTDGDDVDAKDHFYPDILGGEKDSPDQTGSHP